MIPKKASYYQALVPYGGTSIMYLKILENVLSPCCFYSHILNGIFYFKSQLPCKRKGYWIVTEGVCVSIWTAYLLISFEKDPLVKTPTRDILNVYATEW